MKMLARHFHNSHTDTLDRHLKATVGLSSVKRDKQQSFEGLYAYSVL